MRLSRRRLILGITAGSLLASNLGVFVGRRFFRRTDAHVLPRPIEVSFAGPFAYDQQILKSSISNAWIELTQVMTCDRNSRALARSFKFNGPVDSHRKVKVLVTATTSRGRTYRLEECEYTDPRVLKDTLSHSRPVACSTMCYGVLRLPIVPAEIARLNVQIASVK